MDNHTLKEVIGNYIIDLQEKGIKTVTASDIYKELTVTLDGFPFSVFTTLFTESCKEHGFDKHGNIYTKFLTADSSRLQCDVLVYL